MKSIMYHYVQSFSKSFKNFSFLHFRNFEKQIHLFKKKYKFFDCLELFEKKLDPRDKIFLTFDDGLSCHYNYVFKILKKEKINAIFYIPTLPYQKNKVLDVHKVHLILGKIGAHNALKELNEILSKNKSFLDLNLKKKFQKKIYTDHKKNSNTQIFKSNLNYFIKPLYKKTIINKIFLKIFGKEEEKICRNFYLSETQIKEMVKNNMIIGSHSVSHKIMSELSSQEYKKEIDNSFKFINNFFQKKTFSYPYGGFHSFNKNIEKYLNSKDVSFSVNVESKEIKKYHLNNRRQAFPRFDCNEFKYGKIN
tara:strand:+ start:277 stop:1197 length:921 start_codon:yes stop_codon:yes gene_type:complete